MTGFGSASSRQSGCSIVARFRDFSYQPRAFLACTIFRRILSHISTLPFTTYGSSIYSAVAWTLSRFCRPISECGPIAVVILLPSARFANLWTWQRFLFPFCFGFSILSSPSTSSSQFMTQCLTGGTVNDNKPYCQDKCRACRIFTIK